jgi:hypothetical protein
MAFFARTKIGAIVGGVAAIAAAATVGIFATFAPSPSRGVWWLVMADVIAVELASAYLFVRQFQSSVGRDRHGPSPATQIAIASTAGVVSMIGLAADAYMLARFQSVQSDRVLAWLIVGRWVVLGAISVPILLSDEAHHEGRAELTLVQQDRLALIESVENALAQLRRIQPTDAERPALRQLTDEVDAMRNRMRGWASANVSHDPGRITQLIETFAAQTERCCATDGEKRSTTVADLQQTTRAVTRELSGPTMARLN